MNKFDLYRQAFGTCPVRKEWYTKNWITIWYDTFQTLTKEEKVWWNQMYPDKELTQSREQRQKLPLFEELQKESAWQIAGWLVWRGCNYPEFEQKLWTAMYQQIACKISLDNTLYLSELFVNPEQQGQWVWKALLQNYIQSSKNKKNITWILTRTTTLKPNPEWLFLKQWFKKIANYNDEKKRALYYKSL